MRLYSSERPALVVYGEVVHDLPVRGVKNTQIEFLPLEMNVKSGFRQW